MAEVRYRASGAEHDWRLAVEGDALVVLPASVPVAAVESVWRKVGSGGIGSVLEALTGAFGTSLAAIPPFALAIVEPGGVRVAVRGALQVVVEDAEGVHAVSGEGVATWTERLLPDVGRFGIAPLGQASGEVLGAEDAFPIRSGVVAVTGVTVDVADAAVPAPVPAPVAVAVGAAAPATKDAPATDAAVPAPAAARPAPTTVQPDSDLAPASAAPVAAGPDEIVTAAEVPATVPASTDASADTWMPAETGATGSADVSALSEDDVIWGATIARPLVTAAAGEPAAPAASAVPAAPTIETLGDHDGETVAVADIRAMRAAERETFESTDGVPARRPARGRIVLSTGRTVELERPVVIGRRPKSVRTSGSELPTLVAVDSPDQDISRSHVEIRAEGEHVLVTDLDTTNGTVLLRAGQEPVRLHPGEPTMVITGDVLDIGDGVTVAFEDLP